MQHYDIDGNPVSLLKLIRAEPEWAQSQIITLRATISRLDALLTKARTYVEDAAEEPGDDYCFHAKRLLDKIDAAMAGGEHGDA